MRERRKGARESRGENEREIKRGRGREKEEKRRKKKEDKGEGERKREYKTHISLSGFCLTKSCIHLYLSTKINKLIGIFPSIQFNE